MNRAALGENSEVIALGAGQNQEKSPGWRGCWQEGFLGLVRLAAAPMLTLRPFLRVALPLLLQETFNARFFHQRVHALLVPARACEA